VLALGHRPSRLQLPLVLALAPPPPTPALAALRPAIVARPIPFGARRRRETAAYALRHYGVADWRLRAPRVIVEHVAVAGSVDAVRATFVPDRPDPELHEPPGTCAHFVVGADGSVVQLVALGTMCRHTVGLNDVAIGIEHVGFSDGDVLGDRRQLRASLRLTRWLRCRFGIAVRDVIGHAESLTSPYHHERVARLRRQTHADWRAASMRVYRRRLRALGPCPAAQAAAPAGTAAIAASSRAGDISR
jgi:beta-N-acetylhexosaminidase